jgi:hypothetical protein
MHLLAEGSERVAETLGDLLLTAAIHEDGVEGFVEALGSSGGLEKEEASGGVVHNGLQGCESFRQRIRSRRIAEWRRVLEGGQGETVPATAKQDETGVRPFPGKAGGQGARGSKGAASPGKGSHGSVRCPHEIRAFSASRVRN